MTLRRHDLAWWALAAVLLPVTVGSVYRATMLPAVTLDRCPRTEHVEIYYDQSRKIYTTRCTPNVAEPVFPQRPS